MNIMLNNRKGDYGLSGYDEVNLCGEAPALHEHLCSDDTLLRC